MAVTFMDTLNQLTLRQPGIAPAWMTGSGPHAALMTGLGAAAGHYLLPWAVQRLVPNADPDRVERVGKWLGGAAGLALAAPSLAASYSIGSDHGGPGEGLKNLFNGYGWPQNPDLYKKANFWTEPTVNPGQMSETMRAGLLSGAIDPVGAVQMQRALQQQQTNTPSGFGAALVNNLVAGGVGFGTAYMGGRLAGAALGAIGAASPAQQTSLALQTGLIGAAANIIGNIYRR